MGVFRRWLFASSALALIVGGYGCSSNLDNGSSDDGALTEDSGKVLPTSQTDLLLYQGYNTVFDQGAGGCVTYPTDSPVTVGDIGVDAQITFVNSREQLAQQLGFDAQASFKLPQAGVDGRAQVMNSFKRNSASTNLLIRVGTYFYVDGGQTYTLTDEARALLQSDPRGFLQRCGDAVVTRLQYRAEVLGLLRLETNDQEKSVKASTDASVTAPALGSLADANAKVGATIDRLKTATNANLTLELYSQGFSPGGQISFENLEGEQVLTRLSDLFAKMDASIAADRQSMVNAVAAGRVPAQPPGAVASAAVATPSTGATTPADVANANLDDGGAPADNTDNGDPSAPSDGDGGAASSGTPPTNTGDSGTPNDTKGDGNAVAPDSPLPGTTPTVGPGNRAAIQRNARLGALAFHGYGETESISMSGVTDITQKADTFLRQVGQVEGRLENTYYEEVDAFVTATDPETYNLITTPKATVAELAPIAQQWTGAIKPTVTTTVTGQLRDAQLACVRYALGGDYTKCQMTEALSPLLTQGQKQLDDYAASGRIVRMGLVYGSAGALTVDTAKAACTKTGGRFPLDTEMPWLKPALAAKGGVSWVSSQKCAKGVGIYAGGDKLVCYDGLSVDWYDSVLSSLGISTRSAPVFCVNNSGPATVLSRPGE